MAEEIKSTLEIALEKAAKLGKASKEELEIEKLKEEAQKLSAKFLRDEVENFEKVLKEFLKNKNPNQKKVILQSMAKVFLRNIVLPNNEYQLEDGKKALKGLNLILKQVPEINKLSQSIEKLLKEYLLHQQAIYKELLKRFSSGVEALEKAISNEIGTQVKINVEEHPQFKEEWNKIKQKLSEEYERQLEYMKNIFEKIVS
ncbi:MAG: hypothetical protein NZ530_00875 [Thermodesulfobacteriaceae bacterium]|nr:hypothetical protein [Thermodesulfobacteriaceae bacterium]MCX8042180.1 hypothetical protein [Thermodesulfobacteriaceae bacterium]MDW8136498.1 hypothetical protein [Thermodesulfobacterium sp.]